MIELKLLHNQEIQNDAKRNDYKSKFIQYTRATNACLSVFWVFDTNHDGCNQNKFDKLKSEYETLNNTMVILTKCKCRCQKETGIEKSKLNSKSKKLKRKIKQ